MVITDFLRPEHVLTGLRPATKARLLESLSDTAAKALGARSQAIFDALDTRESLGSTGVGQGVAIPHARLPGQERLFSLFARLQRPIDFVAVDGKPVDLVFLLLIPETASAEHLAALACVSRRLRARGVPERLRAARNATEIYALLTDTP
jgi:PTS system nitrogen regulatory IIA component